jgi:hypothetical protein
VKKLSPLVGEAAADRPSYFFNNSFDDAAWAMPVNVINIKVLTMTMLRGEIHFVIIAISL